MVPGPAAAASAGASYTVAARTATPRGSSSQVATPATATTATAIATHFGQVEGSASAGRSIRNCSISEVLSSKKHLVRGLVSKRKRFPASVRGRYYAANT